MKAIFAILIFFTAFSSHAEVSKEHKKCYLELSQNYKSMLDHLLGSRQIAISERVDYLREYASIAKPLGQAIKMNSLSEMTSPNHIATLGMLKDQFLEVASGQPDQAPTKLNLADDAKSARRGLASAAHSIPSSCPAPE